MMFVIITLLISIWEVRGMIRNHTRGISVFAGLAVITLVLCYFAFLGPRGESLGGIIIKTINAVFYRGDNYAGE